MTAARGPTIATVASALACLAAALLPWLQTGEATRSAFGLARSASVLGLFDGAPRRICLALWYLLPFLVAATWTAAAAGKPALAAWLGAIVGATSLAAGILVSALVKAEPGPVLAIAAGAASLISATFVARKVIAQDPNRG